MADNPFHPKFPYSSLLSMFRTPPSTTFLGGAASDLFPPPKPAATGNPFGAAASNLFGPPLSTLWGYAQATKRKTFFSFHYDDIMRVNVVRNAWKIVIIPTII